MGLRLQPRNEKFFTRFSKAGSNVVESDAILREFVAAPHERWAELAKRLHDTQHAGDDTTSVGEPDEGGSQDETASIDDGVRVVSSRKAAPMLEVVEGTFDDVAALDSLWAEELTVTVPEMPVMTKTEVLGVWRSGRATITRYETSPTRVQVYADAAVVEGRLHRSRTFNGRTADDHWRFTKLHVRQGGPWRVVAYHASTVPPR